MSPQGSSSGPAKQFPDHLHMFQAWKWVKQEGPENSMTKRLLTPNDEEFSILAAAVHYGLRMVETNEGRRALEKTGTHVCVEWLRDERYGVTATRTGPVSRNMKGWVNHFVSRLRDGFFNLVLMETQGSDGILNPVPAERRQSADADWPTEPEKFGHNSYDPKKMGYMVLNFDGRFMLMHEARKFFRNPSKKFTPEECSKALVAIQVIMFCLSATIAHEVTHAFRCFVSELVGGRGQPFPLHTPGPVYYNPYSGTLPGKSRHRKKARQRGESGAVFDLEVFGGLTSVQGDDVDFEDCFHGLYVEITHFLLEKLEHRRIPDEVIGKFFDDPKGFSFTAFKELGSKHQVEGEDLEESDEEAGIERKLARYLTSGIAGPVSVEEMEAFREARTYSFKDTRVIEDSIRKPPELIQAERDRGATRA